MHSSNGAACRKVPMSRCRPFITAKPPTLQQRSSSAGLTWDSANPRKSLCCPSMDTKKNPRSQTARIGRLFHRRFPWPQNRVHQYHLRQQGKGSRFTRRLNDRFRAIRAAQQFRAAWLFHGREPRKAIAGCCARAIPPHLCRRTLRTLNSSLICKP
jgi:hypothetical protein